ncbi:MAG: thiamine-phosphate kinase [Alphaproteobacteria bacterium]
MVDDPSHTDMMLPAEFSRISRYFAPLAHLSGAAGLLDDAAILDIPSDQDLIVTNDSVVAGIHYRGDEPANRVAQKLMRRNLSDLAAMGASPHAYNLSFAIPAETPESWIAGFAQGLGEDQRTYGLSLIGGDSLAVPCVSVLGMTMFGVVPKGRIISRKGAMAGDNIYCSGTIGDGFLGLKASRGEFSELSNVQRETLITRYELPLPRLSLGIALRGIATAMIDISDGFMADLNHICRVSGVGAHIETARIPFSSPAKEILQHTPSLLSDILTGGDDYELLFAAPPSMQDRITVIAKELSLSITYVGRMRAEQKIQVVDPNHQPLSLKQRGYTHFD